MRPNQRQAAVALLRAHPSLYRTWPDVPPGARLPRRRNHEPDPYGIAKRWTLIGRVLRDAGVVSKNSYVGDVDVPALIAAVRDDTRRPQ